MGRDVPKDQDKLFCEKSQYQVQFGILETNPVGQKKSGMSVRNGKREIGGVSRKYGFHIILVSKRIVYRPPLFY